MTVRLQTYINKIREEYQIPKTKRIRHYESVEEQPMGKQMQVDRRRQRSKKPKRRKKLISTVFVLSYRIRAINILNGKIVRLLRGIQSEVMKTPLNIMVGCRRRLFMIRIDLITVSENAGDIILTGEFQSYKEQRGFRMYLCRKSN